MKETDPVIETPRYIENATLDGIGYIAPREYQRQRLPELLTKLDQAYTTVQAPYLIPYMCMDGRRIEREPGDTRPDGPTAAGGTLTLTVARDLSGYDYVASDLASLHYELASDLLDNGYPVGGHCKNIPSLRTGDRNVTDHSTGCWANDNMDIIYRILSERATDIAQFAGVCDIAISRSTIDMVSQAAADRLERKQWLPQPDDGGLRLVAEELDEVDRTALVELTSEPHAKCAVIINTHEHTTIDRSALRQMFDEQRMDVFSIDLWALRKAAYAIGASCEADSDAQVVCRISESSEAASEELYEAMVLYNFAALFSCCGRGMPVVVR